LWVAEVAETVRSFMLLESLGVAGSFAPAPLAVADLARLNKFMARKQVREDQWKDGRKENKAATPEIRTVTILHKSTWQLLKPCGSAITDTINLCIFPDLSMVQHT
jgi:hypothetical protein